MVGSDCANEFIAIFRQAERYGRKLDAVQHLQSGVEDIELKIQSLKEARIEVLEEYKRNLPDKKEELKIQKDLFDLEESRLKNAIEELLKCECGGRRKVWGPHTHSEAKALEEKLKGEGYQAHIESMGETLGKTAYVVVETGRA